MLEFEKLGRTDWQHVRKQLSLPAEWIKSYVNVDYLNHFQVICQNPDRETSTQKLEDIKEELHQLEETEASLDLKLELRKKQFYVLVQSIHELQKLLDQENDEDSVEVEQNAAAANSNNDNIDLNISNISSGNGEGDNHMDLTWYLKFFSLYINGCEKQCEE